MAALIKDATGSEAELIEGGRGEFTVWVGQQLVAEKGSSGFPEDRTVVDAVRQVLASK